MENGTSQSDASTTERLTNKVKCFDCFFFLSEMQRRAVTKQGDVGVDKSFGIMLAKSLDFSFI